VPHLVGKNDDARPDDAEASGKDNRTP